MSIGETWQQLTLFAEDTPASRSASQEPGTAPTTLSTYGRNSQTLLGFYDPDTHCWRTSQGTLTSDLATCLQTWPRAGMTHNGIAYQLQPSAPRTSATEYSLSLHGKPLEWTPTATANQTSMLSRNPAFRIGPNSQGLWPTPLTQDYTTRFAQGGMPLGMAVRMTEPGNTGKLNPTWVEWLMGFPTGWTDFEH